jgi:hypothetical protein
MSIPFISTKSLLDGAYGHADIDPLEDSEIYHLQLLAHQFPIVATATTFNI